MALRARRPNVPVVGGRRKPTAGRRRALRACTLILALAACVCWANWAAAGEPKAELTGVMTTDYFVVRYDPSDPYLAQLAADTAIEELLRVSRDLGYKVENNRPFPLYVYPTHYAFIEAGGLETQKFTVGTARTWDERISVDASGAFVSTQEVLAHEITHAVVFRLLGRHVGALPLWANEGLAKYESTELATADDMLVGRAAGDGMLISLSRLETDFPEDQTALAYAESASAMRYMIEVHGKSAPRKLLAELAEAGSFDKAMRSATGLTPEQFADDWFENITLKYRGLRVSTIITGVVSALMATLAIIAFLVRRRQKIEAARRWDDEELDEAIRLQAGNEWWR